MPRKPSPEKKKCAPKESSNIIDFPVRQKHSSSSPLVNIRELCSIKAMTAYVAHNQNVREETVRAMIEAEFDVSNIEQLNRDDFERVIAYLVDLRCELLLN